ncbi:sigma-70 family RNA polymerase sigma factor [Dyadobacter sp. CY261]|uniref:RNA polymerase sigma factor n=1 Tax=Dyadobacter sp. CY261 TaxID=2907203 RepID=UPI001F46EF75|nr:sigma-70 family RNA polymerase sigma factor [Dyadobacter sp. CY261]MCF0072807.1 sigma-70 family RNA polymerase sigma factor [Dyadobacter sp. CY261]
MDKKPLPNEADLLIRVSCGDENAYKQLYDHYSTTIYRVAYRYLQSADMAEDVVQEIFLAIWNKRSDFREIRAFQSYLFFMTKNLCLKHIKDLAKELTANSEFAERVNVDEPDATGHYQELLDKALQQLPPQQKRAFELAKIQGLSHEMVAGILNLSASTVNNHITAALKSIKLRLQQYTIGLVYLISLLLQ